MLLCFWFPNCDGSNLLCMSDMTSSEMIVSMILFRLQRLEIGLSISLSSGGNCFGVGVMVSLLYTLGQWPTLRPEFMMSDTGTDMNGANSLMILAGMSPGAVDLLVFIFWRYFLTWHVLICGMSEEEKGGICMTSFFYRFILIADGWKTISYCFSLIFVWQVADFIYL